VTLAGQIALVSGASRGIGRGIALRLAHDGAVVVVCARDAARVMAVCEEIESDGGVARPAVGDVTSSTFVNGLVEEVIAELGRIDILVNNVGGTQPAPFASLEDYDYDSWWQIVDLNLTSHFICLQAVIPHMVEQGGGKIVSISSLAGIAGVPSLWSPAYCAAKSGVIGLMKQVALEFGAAGIRANAVAPSDVETERMAELAQTGSYFETADQLSERYKHEPVPRPARVEEIAATVAFLVSDESSYITGETLNVVGGSYVAP
jgi:NAD(P)-dependent dehydrogenase (short-subunit alcohol dehydrogenase family)